MTEKEVNKNYPLLTLLTGLISFLIIGIITGFISLKTNEGLLLILGIPAGTLLMLFLLRKADKNKILAIIILSEIGGFAGFLAGFGTGELISGAIGFIAPSLGDLTQIKAQIIPNLFVLIIGDAIFGAILAGLIYGRKAISFFAIVCGLASIPFGLLLSLPFDITLIRFDQNMLFMLTSFGASTGLSIGLYKLLKSKDI
jgi:hypothetical protein